MNKHKPVIYASIDDNGFISYLQSEPRDDLTPLYAHPSEWKSLDMQEIGELSWKASDQLIKDGLKECEYPFEFYELIEQALKKLNAKK